MKTLGQQLKEARELKGLTVQKLANRTNLAERTIYRAEGDGDKLPTMETILAVARELRYPLRFAVRGEVMELVPAGNIIKKWPKGRTPEDGE